MKAVVLAGGEGSRLRPLTCTIPKPMARIFGKPIIEYIFEMLYRSGVTNASVTLGYLPHIIENEYENRYKKLNLKFFREDTPLGTAGSVKMAASGFNEPFFVVSGDAMCNFDLSKMMAYHKASGAKITIVATAQKDPREFGVVRVDRENRVLGFIEKPSWSQAVSNLANTGVYIINPECLELIPNGKSYDFARDLFPMMLERDMPIFCYNTDDYWCDVGSIASYMECQKDIFEKRMSCFSAETAEGIYAADKIPHGDYSINPPVYIGKNVEIGDGAVIGPYAVIDDNNYIGKNSKIRYSTVLENCCVADNVSLTGALICSGAAVKRNAEMFENSVAGSGSVIGMDSVVKQNVLVWPGKVIGKEANVSRNVKYGNVRAEIISDNGVSDECGRRLDAETCVKLGMAVGSTQMGKKCGIATDSTKFSKVLKMALISGVLGSGGAVWDFGECFEAQLNYLINFCDLSVGLFVHGGEKKGVRICGEKGLPISRSIERSIESFMAKEEFHESEEAELKEVFDMSGVTRIYKQELFKQAPCGLGGVSVNVCSDNAAVQNLVSSVLTKLGCNLNGECVIRIDDSGMKAFASVNGEVYDHDKLIAACCLDELKKGHDIAVPYEAPAYIDTLAESFGKKVYRYLRTSADNSDFQARRLAAKQVFAVDGVFLAVRLLSILKERECRLEDLIGELPEKYVVKKTVTIDFSPSDLSVLLGEEKNSVGRVAEGVRIVRDGNRLLVIPERSGESVKIFAESDSFEAASELCGSVEEILKKYNQ